MIPYPQEVTPAQKYMKQSYGHPVQYIENAHPIRQQQQQAAVAAAAQQQQQQQQVCNNHVYLFRLFLFVELIL